MELLKYSTTITLYSSYFDSNDRLTAKSILSIFQDVASIHAEEIGVGFNEMFNKNLYWVLSRIKFDIIKMPEINQKVIVETWPHIKGRIDFDRDMKILNEAGEVLIIATSKWCVIDTINRMLQRTDNVNYNGECLSEVNYEERLKKIDLPDSSQMAKKFQYVVRYCDIDRNKHMNNTNYANLVLSAIENKYYTHFEINYLNECLLNDEICVSLISDTTGEYVIGSVKEKNVFTAFVK